MHAQKYVITPDSIDDDSNTAQQRIQDFLATAHMLEMDASHSVRLENSHCRCCHYLRKNRVGGAAITHRPCGVCDEDMAFGSTATDVICMACAKKNNLCRQCGARMDV